LLELIIVECDALCVGLPNNPIPWTENSQWCD